MRLWLKIGMVAAMTLAILIPLLMIRGLIFERQRYRDEAVADIAASVGQAQVVAGPVLVVPYSERVEREVRDANGVTRQVGERRERQWQVFPDTLKVQGTLASAIRKRGLHQVRIYDWQGELDAVFDWTVPDDAPPGSERRIGQPYLSWGISDVRGLQGTPRLSIDGQPALPAQGSGIESRGGLHAPLPATPQPGQRLRTHTQLALTLGGSERFAMMPLARSNDFSLKSDWPHPSFAGLLPQHRIGADGFQARWQVDALATTAQQQWQEHGFAGDARDLARVSLVDPVNLYVQADRASKYGLLFVLLTFAGFFMFELLRQVRLHPIQYALVGLAIAIFFLLLLSLSEHIAFVGAYALAALACIGLIGVYLAAVLRGWRPALVFTGMLGLLYAALYGLLVLEDNALAVGSGLLFVILAAIMLATRRLDWYALSAQRGAS
ncbi:cell envelope integrity protein CreD [Luteimonas sp. e5]